MNKKQTFSNTSALIIVIVAMVLLVIPMAFVVIAFGYSIIAPDAQWMNSRTFLWSIWLIFVVILCFCAYSFLALFEGRDWARKSIGVYLLLLIAFMYTFSISYKFYVIPVALILAYQFFLGSRVKEFVKNKAYPYHGL